MDKAQHLRFGEFVLDPARFELRREGQLLTLEPKPLRVLLHLIEHRDRVVSKDELLAAVWSDSVVSETAFSSAIHEIRRVLGDQGVAPRWIRTRRRLGYQFIGEVEETPGAPGDQHADTDGNIGGPTRLYGAPRGPSQSFVGRTEELSALAMLLTSHVHASVQASIEGLAGVGKTELALQLAYRLADERSFPGGIFWLDAENPDLRATWGNAIADQYGIPGGPAEERAAKLLRELTGGCQPLLIVLDNVISWEPGARPLPLPGGAHVRVLATTRMRYLAGNQFRHFELGVLKPPHDRELVLRNSGRRAGPWLGPLLERLAGHALALELAVAFLGSFPSESEASYLGELGRDAEAAEGEVLHRVGYERTVTQCFRTVWDRLHDGAREAWWLASFFESNATWQTAVACGIPRPDFRRLEELHLVQSSDDRWSMHRLTREFGQQHPPEPERELELLLAMGPQLMRRGISPAGFTRVYQRAVDLASRTGQHGKVLSALEGLWQGSSAQGEWARAEELSHRMEELAGKGDARVYWLSICRARAETCFHMGRIDEACLWFDRGIAAVTSDGGNLPAVLHAPASMLSHAALASCLAGQPERGVALGRQSCELAARIQQPATQAMAWAAMATLNQFLDEPEQVERYAARALDVHRRHEVPIFGYIASVQSSWARLVGGAADPEDLESFQTSLAALLKLNLRVGRSAYLGWLAQVHLRLGRREEALAALAEGLRCVQTTGERFFEPELWRLQAKLASSPREALHCLERSAEVAARGGSRWFALKTACDLCESADTEATRAEAQRQLLECYSGFSEGFAFPAVRRALSLLEAASPGVKRTDSPRR